MQKGEGAAPAPTGCYKCGRPGHWARDCTLSSGSNSNPNPNSSSRHNLSSSNSFKQSSTAPESTAAAAKKVPRSRPKLTQEMLLSEDGLGYVLRHFPRAFKYHGRGHEVADLGNLIGMYAEWHSHLLPYYSFNQFIQKVEKVGASRRVRRCIGELRDRVARGGDATKLHEPPVELVDPDEGQEQCGNEDMDVEEPAVDVGAQPLEGHDTEHMQEEMINEIYQNATDQSVQTPHVVVDSAADPVPAASVGAPNHMPDIQQKEPTKIQITDEQKARMEANRLKALERAKQARSSTENRC